MPKDMETRLHPLQQSAYLFTASAWKDQITWAIMGHQKVYGFWRHLCQPLLLRGLNVVRLERVRRGRTPDASYSQEGDGFFAVMEDQRAPGFQAPDPLINIYRKVRGGRPLFQAIEPGMVLMVAPDKNQRAGGPVKQVLDSGGAGHEVFKKAKHPWLTLAVAAGSTIHPASFWKHSQVAHLHDQIKRLSGCLLKARRLLKDRKQVPMYISN
jgi:hypothetical protein